jgi:hypothetical protein
MVTLKGGEMPALEKAVDMPIAVNKPARFRDFHPQRAGILISWRCPP